MDYKSLKKTDPIENFGSFAKNIPYENSPNKKDHPLSRLLRADDLFLAKCKSFADL
jgi:hypothetical protein